jgi:hypothetical protein
MMRFTMRTAFAVMLLLPRIVAAQSPADTSAVISVSLSAMMTKWKMSAKDTLRISPYFYEQTTSQALKKHPPLPVTPEAVRQVLPPEKGVSELVSDEVIRRCNRKLGDCLRANGRNEVVWFDKPQFDVNVANMLVVRHVTFPADARGRARGHTGGMSTTVYKILLRRSGQTWVVTSLTSVGGT